MAVGFDTCLPIWSAASRPIHPIVSRTGKLFGNSNLTWKGIHGSHKANKKRQPTRFKVTQIQEIAKDFTSWPVRSEVNQWDYKTEETQNVEEQHARFDPWEKAAEKRIDD